MDIKVDKFTFEGKNHYQVFIDGVKFPNVSNYVKLRSKKFYIPEDTFKSHYSAMFKNEQDEKSFVIKLAKSSYKVMEEFGMFE